MPDAVAAIALGVAVIAAIIGLSFYRHDIWLALNEKRPGRSGPGDVPIGPDGGGPTFGGGSDGGAA